METSTAVLENFAALAKEAKGRALRSLVLKAIDCSHLFHFGDLVTAVESSPEGLEPWVDRLLRIFAYGDVKDLIKAVEEGEVPVEEVNAGRLQKLRLLTLVELAARRRCLKMSAIVSAMNFDSKNEMTSGPIPEEEGKEDREEGDVFPAAFTEVEDLVADAVDVGLLEARIDEEKSLVEIVKCCARDVRTSDMPVLLATLESLDNRLAVVEKHIECQGKAPFVALNLADMLVSQLKG